MDFTKIRSTLAYAASLAKKRAPVGLLFLFLLACMPAALAAPLAPAALIPQPREMRASGTAPFPASVSIVAPGEAEDRFAAEQLRRQLEAAQIRVARAPAAYRILLLRAAAPQGRRLLAEARQSFTPAMHDEGYVLIAHRREAAVIAETGAGVFYGAQTLFQMLQQGKGSELTEAVIRDWPAMRYRAIQDDLSRGPVPTLAFQKHQIEVFASYKINIYSPYFENSLAYRNQPLIAPPGGAMSPADVAELVRYARQFHIMVVPEQEAFGHLHHVLKFDLYSPLGETPRGHVLAPGDPGSIEIIKSWFGEIAQEFPAPFLHVGADETFELGRGRTRPEVERRGLGPVYVDFLTQVHNALEPLHKRLLFWGDIAIHDPASLRNLPKDMIAMPWVYDAEPSYDRYIAPFRDAGMETWVTPGDSNWNVVFPNANVAFPNIQIFVRDGQRLNSTGAMVAIWNDDGEGLFNQDWYGALFGAAASWQPGTSDISAYQNAFAPLFFGDASGKLGDALRELMAAHAALAPAGVGSVYDDLFWADPWSADGQALAAKLRPVVAQMRLHAERAIVLADQARAADPHLREQDAIQALDLGARRIDLVGLLVEASDDMAAAYAAAYKQAADKNRSAETEDLLDEISSMNGRCQDLRDGYSETRELYRQVWLGENRPYWLENVLVRYDLAIEQWQRRGAAIQQVRDRWRETGQLPPARQIGMPDPPQTSPQ